MIRHVTWFSAVCLALAGCGNSATDAADLPKELQQIVPTETPTPSITAQPDDSPVGWREVRDEHFSVRVPADYRERTTETEHGTKYEFVWQGAEAEDEVVAVIITPEQDAVSGAIEQSYVFETTNEAIGTEVNRSLVEWPGAQQAVFLQWERGRSGRTVPQTMWQLYTTPTPGIGQSILVTAPKNVFDETELQTILQTFRSF